jgi:RHS repeat-associated protein
VGDHYEATLTSETCYVFAGSLRIAQVNQSGAITYYHKDHLGSSSVLTNGAGTETGRAEYRPFGEARGPASSPLTRYLYTDQEWDSGAGLYNYNARMYDPVLGRFTTPDSIIPDVYDPQGLNPYAYRKNSLLIYVDPTGCKGEDSDDDSSIRCTLPSMTVTASRLSEKSNLRGGGGGDGSGPKPILALVHRMPLPSRARLSYSIFVGLSIFR